MSRRSVWLAVLHRQEESGTTTCPLPECEPSAVPALLRGRWRPYTDDDTNTPAAGRERGGPILEVTE